VSEWMGVVGKLTHQFRFVCLREEGEGGRCLVNTVRY